MCVRGDVDPVRPLGRGIPGRSLEHGTGAAPHDFRVLPLPSVINSLRFGRRVMGPHWYCALVGCFGYLGLNQHCTVVVPAGNAVTTISLDSRLVGFLMQAGRHSPRSLELGDSGSARVNRAAARPFISSFHPKTLYLFRFCSQPRSSNKRTSQLVNDRFSITSYIEDRCCHHGSLIAKHGRIYPCCQDDANTPHRYHLQGQPPYTAETVTTESSCTTASKARDCR